MYQKLIVLISLISLKLVIGTESSSIIFPGSVAKHDDYRNTHTDQPIRRPVTSTDVNPDWNGSSRSSNTPRPLEKSFGRRNPSMNGIDKHGEESRINEKYNLKTSDFDDLPYDFSKTDKIHRVSDLLRFLGIEDKKKNDEDGLMTRKSNDDPTQVSCHSEMRTVDLATELQKHEKNEDFKVFPECVKARRCAGCCGALGLSGRVCLPTKIEKISVNAAVIRVKRSCDDSSCSSEIDKNNVRKVFQIDSHEECQCRCAHNGDVCTENQDWDESLCKCVCKNTESMRSACESNAMKMWKDQSCECKCKKVLACSTGLIFSHKTCSCARKGQ